MKFLKVSIHALLTGFLCICFSTNILAQRRDTAVTSFAYSESQQALSVVEKRIAGYNSHDIEAFLAAHDENVQIFEYPDRKIGEGRAHLRRLFGPQFERKQGHVDVAGQFSVDNKVVSRETTTIDMKTEQLIVIYTIGDGVIKSLRLIESRE